MNTGNLIFLPAINNLRQWFLNQKKEKERKRILRIQKDEIRICPHTEIENEEEMKKYLLSSTYRDSDGNQRKTKKLGRTMESYYRR